MATDTDSIRAARLAAIRARRGTPERIAAVAAIAAAHAAEAPAARPEGDEVAGFAHELRADDFVTTIGGRHGGVDYRRHGINDVVTLAGQTPRQRTRGIVVFARLGEYTMPTWYPVRYVRPAVSAS